MSKNKQPALISLVKSLFSADDNTLTPSKKLDYLQQIFTFIPAVVYIRDNKQNLLAASNQAKELLGIVKTRNKNVMSGEFITKDKDLDIIILKHKTSKEEKITYLNTEGATRIAIIKKVPLFIEKKTPSAVLTMLTDITERTTKEMETINSRTTLKNILDHAPMAIYTRGASGGLTFWNKKALEIFEDDDESIAKPGAHAFQNKKQADSYQSREEEILREGKVVVYPQEEYITRNGHKLMLHITKIPMQASEENPETILTIVQDITERYIQEQENAKTQNLIQTILNNAPLAVYARDEKGNLIFRNSKTSEMHGCINGEMPKETPEQIEFYKNREKSIFKDKKPLIIGNEEYTGADGKKRILRAIKAPVFDNNGKPLMVVTIGEDITDTKEKEREVLRTKNFLNDVIDNLPVALFAKNYEGKYIMWNKKSAEVFGKTAEEVIGKTSYNDDLNPEQQEFIRMQDQSVFDMRRELDIPQEIISTQKSGIKIMHTVKTPLYFEDGKPNCLLGISEDITLKTKMEKQVYEAKTQYSLLVENCRECILTIEQGKVSFANKTLLKMLKYTSEELVGKDFISLIAQENKQVAQEFYDKISLQTATQDIVTLKLNTKTDETFEFETSAVRSKYLGKHIVIMFLRKISSSEKQESANIIKDRRFQQFFEKNPTPYVILQKNGYVYDMNKSARQLLGFTLEDKPLYCSIFVMPGLPLPTRKAIQSNQGHNFNTSINFDKLKQKISGIVKSGTINLQVNMTPFNERLSTNGTITSDFVLELHQKEITNLSTDELSTSISSEDMLTYQDAVLLCSNRGIILKCNSLAEQLLGKNFLNLHGRNITELFNEQSALCIKNDMEELYKQGSIKSRDYTLNEDFGNLSVEGSAIMAKGNNFLISFRNITLKRQLLNLLQERSLYVDALKQALGGALLECELKDGYFSPFTDVSNEMCKLSGYTKNELFQLSFVDLLTNEKSGKELEKTQAFLSNKAHRLEDGKPVVFEANLLFKKSKLSCQVSLAPYTKNKITKVIAILTETEKQHNLANSLSNTEKELASIKEVIEGLYLKLDKTGFVEELRGNQQDFAGLSVFNLLGKNLLDLLDKKDKEQLKNTLDVSLQTKALSKGSFTIKTSNTHYFYDYTLSPLEQENKLVMLIRNVDERKGLENKIKRLYFLSTRRENTFVENMDDILMYGNQLFNAKAGLICHLSGANKEKFLINYTTENKLDIKKNNFYYLGSCLKGVKDGAIVADEMLNLHTCKDCLHDSKNLKSILAAPLTIKGKIEGFICFVSDETMRLSEEEKGLIEFMARLISMALETRQANKAANSGLTSMRKFMASLDIPSVIIDSNLGLKNINDSTKTLFDIFNENDVLDQNIFSCFAYDPLKAEGDFKSSYKLSKGGSFDFMFDLRLPQGKRVNVIWHVVEIRDGRDKVRGFLLASENIKELDLLQMPVNHFRY